MVDAESPQANYMGAEMSEQSKSPHSQNVLALTSTE